MPRNSQPRSTRQASKATREQRAFWHKLARAIGEGALSTDSVVAR